MARKHGHKPKKKKGITTGGITIMNDDGPEKTATDPLVDEEDLSSQVNTNSTAIVEIATSKVMRNLEAELQAFAEKKLEQTTMFMSVVRSTRGIERAKDPFLKDVSESLKNFERAGRPKLTFRTCGSGDGPDEIFCIWAIYDDLFLNFENANIAWSLPPSMPFPRSFDFKTHSGLGQCMVASRALFAGDLISIERPILIMPMLRAGIEDKDFEQCLEDMFYKLKAKERSFILGTKHSGLSGTLSLESQYLPYYITLFPSLSRCCHSCGPNATLVFDTKSLLMELRGVRDIKPGEKITISYCNPLMDHKSRQAEIRAMYNFSCTCESCRFSQTAKTSDERRKKAAFFKEEIFDKIWQAGDLDRIIKTHKDALDLLEREKLQICNFPHIKWLVRAYASLGDEENTKYWGKIAQNISITADVGAEAYIDRGIWGMLLGDVTQHPFWGFHNISMCVIKSFIDRRFFGQQGNATHEPLEITYGNMRVNLSDDSDPDSADSNDTKPSNNSLSREDLLAYAHAGSPKMKVFPCRAVDNHDRTFCIWIAYYDVLETFPDLFWWPSVPSSPTISPYNVGPVEDVGAGLISSKYIAPGELIVSENPIILTPVEHLCEGKELDEVVAELAADIYVKFMALPDLQPQDYATKVQRIFESNTIVVKFPQSRFLPWYKGVFPTISRCNHSCSPNAVYAFDPTTLVMELRATRAIRRGDQITFAYYNILEDYETRQKMLLEKYNFRCVCTHCRYHENDRKSNELRRKVLNALNTHLSSHDQNIISQIWTYKDILLAIERENVHQYRYRFIRLLVRAYAAIGDKTNLEFWVKEAAKACLTSCEGIESFKEQSYWESLMEDVKKHPDWNIAQYWRHSRMEKIKT